MEKDASIKLAAGRPGYGDAIGWDSVSGASAAGWRDCVPPTRRRNSWLPFWARNILVFVMLFATALEVFEFALSQFQAQRPQRKESSAVDDRFGDLRFRSDGTFQISIFEDLHFGESMSFLVPCVLPGLAISSTSGWR